MLLYSALQMYYCKVYAAVLNMLIITKIYYTSMFVYPPVQHL